jgi:hypothetical protein
LESNLAIIKIKHYRNIPVTPLLCDEIITSNSLMRIKDGIAGSRMASK